MGKYFKNEQKRAMDLITYIDTENKKFYLESFVKRDNGDKKHMVIQGGDYD